MKLHDYLRQADNDPAGARRTPVTQDEQLLFAVSQAPRPGYWNPSVTTQRQVQTTQYTDGSGNQLGDAVPLPYTTYTKCFVWIEQFSTVEVGDEYLNWRYVGQIPQRAIRESAFQRMACMWPTKRGWVSPGGVGLRLDLIANENGRWWSFTTAGDACTTTTTTTGPPCDCTTHPSMQFTLSGISLRPGAGRCGPNDQICLSLNREWCLPFRGKVYQFGGYYLCEWSYTLSYNNGCPPGSIWYGGTSTQAVIRYGYPKTVNPGTGSFVCPARLEFGIYSYISYDFNPNTGGTFVDGNSVTPWAPVCIGWPTTITVTANANCNPDPPTTTTTTTTTTTSGPPGP